MKDQCEAVVWRRDTYRRVGGKDKFRVHYIKSRCKKSSLDGGLCGHHTSIESRGRKILRVDKAGEEST